MCEEREKLPGLRTANMEPTLQLLACGLVLLLTGDSAASAPRNLQLLGAAGDILADLASAAVSGLQKLVAAAGEAARTAVSALVERTESYLAELRHEPLNITRVVTSSGLVKVVRLLVEDARHLITEASRNISAINFNVVAPNNDLEGAFSFNFQEVNIRIVI